MLKLKLDTVFHLCVKHKTHGTAMSLATIAMSNGSITVRDQVTDAYDDKQRTPANNVFKVYLDPDTEADCVYYPETNELGFIIPRDVQVCRDGHFQRNDKGRVITWPEWRRQKPCYNAAINYYIAVFSCLSV